MTDIESWDAKMVNLDYTGLGELFGEFSVWGKDSLPSQSLSNNGKGVLWELLNDFQNRGYKKHIKSLNSYCRDYQEFSKAYRDSLPNDSRTEKIEYTCVPYWGSNYWKSEKRIAIFAQKSLNRGGISIPLYFPLCEIDSWEKALEIGCLLSYQQEKPFSWQSFMVVWIAMRFLFSNNLLYLQHIYYSDIIKLSDLEKNRRLLEKEIETIQPQLILLFGKKFSDEINPLVDKKNIKVEFIYFPTGQGIILDPRAKKLVETKRNLSNWLNDKNLGNGGTVKLPAHRAGLHG